MKSILLLATLAFTAAFAVQQSEASNSPQLNHKSHHHKVHVDVGKFEGFVCPTESGYFEHENCLKFWQCGNWIAYEMDCAPGTQWSQELLTCDHLTTCQGGGGGGDDGVTEPAQEPEEPNSTPAPEEPEEPATDKPEPPQEGFKCPSESGYFPHEDCWKFWQCGNGIAYEMTCAPGTQWEQEILTCNHLTTCQRPSEPTPEEPENPTTAAPEEPEQPEEPSTAAPEEPEEPENPTTSAPEQPDNGFKCPSESGYFPHEDCWKFWQCGNWIAYEMTCAPGTQWEQEILTCNHLTTCQRPAEPTPEEPENPTTAAPEEPENPTTAAPEEPGNDGTTPGAPENTEQPEEPSTDAPEQPEQPEEPSTDAPEQPEQPEEPSTDAPEQPEQPEEPSTAAPEEPEEPENPTTATPEEPDNGFKCPSESGYFPHEDCWKFWQCGNWIAYEMTCAPGTQWEQEILTCNHLTTCQRPAEPTPEEPENPTTAAPEEPEQPEEPSTAAPEEPEEPENPTTAAPEEPENPTTAAPEEPGNDGTTPGAPENTEQPDEPSTDAPEQPEQPEEPSTSAPEEPEEPENPTTEPDNETTVAPEEPSTPAVEEPENPSTAAPEEPTTSEPEDEAFICPSGYGYFPHKNCWQFWQCGNWIAYEMTCAKGTQWSQELLTCDHLTTCNRPVEPEEPVDKPTTAAPEEPINDPTTSAPEQPEEPSTSAPEEPEEPSTSTPEKPEEPSTSTPEKPEEPSTSAPEQPEEPSTSAPEQPEEPSTSAPEETSTPSSGGNSTQAPFKCPSNYGYFPHADCWKFWQCGNWIAYEMTCAPGTQWAQELLTCDHLTTCNRPAEPPAAEPEPETDPTTAAPTEPSPTSVPEQPSTEKPGNGGNSTFKCPSKYGYFPHNDCWKFWQCGNWIAYEITCAPGTQWSQELLTCDHLTTCNRPANPPAQEEPSTTTTTEAPAPPEEEGFKCPSSNGNFSHEECWKFWQCRQGVAHEMTCPPYTRFDSQIRNCRGPLGKCNRPPQFG